MSYFENKRVNNIKNRLNIIKAEAVNRKIYGVRMSLEKVSTSLAGRNKKITRNTFSLLSGCLDRIESHLKEEYVDMIKNECLKANNIILGKYIAPTKTEEMIEESNTRLTELETKYRKTKDRLTEIDRLMDEALGKDEIEWKKLNKERTFLLGQAMAVGQVFDSLLTNNNNLKNAEVVRELRNRYSNLIIEQQPLIDIDEFTDNVEMNAYTNEESSRQDRIMSEVLYKNCANDDDAYRQALEEKMAGSPSENSLLKTMPSSQGGELDVR